jgi:mannose-1-phosphate guanylyltransferase / phosphomannomutase
VTAPSSIESLVALHGGTVVRTKTDVRSLMSLATAADKKTPQADFAGDGAGGFILSEFMPAFDSMFAFGKLLEMLATTGLSMGEIANELPPAHVVQADVRCPWEVKGRIMREITREATEAGPVDLIDGIKVQRDGAWALVLPDASEPYFHVYAEADTEEKGQAILREYVGKIESLRG